MCARASPQLGLEVYTYEQGEGLDWDSLAGSWAGLRVHVCMIAWARFCIRELVSQLWS